MKKITSFGIFVWTLASLYFLYEFFSRTFIGTLASSIMLQLNLNALELSLIGAVYYLAYAGMQIPVGMIIDRWGVKYPLVLSVLVCTSGLLVFSIANGFYSLMIGRFLMGFGSAFAFVSLLILALNWFPKRNFGFFSGATQILGAIGPILSGAPLVAMLVATDNNWREVLYYVILVGLLLSLLIFIFLQDQPKQRHNPKLYKKRKIPTLQNLKKLITNKQVMWIASYAFCIFASISVLGAIWGTYYLETHGIHRNTAALVTSMIWIGLGLGSPILGYLSDRLQKRQLLLMLCACFAFIITLLIILLPTNSVFVFAVLYFCFGFTGAGQTLSFVIMADHVKSKQRATAMGLNNTAVMLGGAIIPIMIGYIVQFTAQGKALYDLYDFTMGFLIIPVLYLIAAFIAWYKIKDKK